MSSCEFAIQVCIPSYVHKQLRSHNVQNFVNDNNLAFFAFLCCRNDEWLRLWYNAAVEELIARFKKGYLKGARCTWNKSIIFSSIVVLFLTSPTLLNAHKRNRPRNIRLVALSASLCFPASLASTYLWGCRPAWPRRWVQEWARGRSPHS
jgi:hypothetical protein